MGLVTLLGVAVFPDDGVSGCSVLQPGSIREDGESWPVGLLGLVCSCLDFLDGGGCVQWGGYLEGAAECFIMSYALSSQQAATAIDGDTTNNPDQRSLK